MRFNYDWKLKDAIYTKDKGKVFSCFACGGGSSMGYKLAGFDVIGCNEIDPKLMECYKKNHNPKYAFCEPIQTFKLREDLPQELYELDILDMSPPCSTFSSVGNREADWGKEKKFREGQSSQVLDTLFFDGIDLAKKLQPKVVIAENVKGLLMGKAMDYVTRIRESFEEAGYYVQHFLLDASKMGVPQRRERVFFFAMRKDLSEQLAPLIEHWTDMFNKCPELLMTFDEPEIKYGEFQDCNGKDITKAMKEIWALREPEDVYMCDAVIRSGKKRAYFSMMYLKRHEVPYTLTGHEDSLIVYDVPKFTSVREACLIGSYPVDYDFGKLKPHYLIGMSVPPVMMAQIANKVYEQWLSKIKE